MRDSVTPITCWLAAAAVVGTATWMVFVFANNKKNKSESFHGTQQRNEMFRRYPLGPGKVKLSNGVLVSLPYQIYNGWATAINGVCDLEAAKKVCEMEAYQPVQTTSGHALALLSFWDFTQTNTGPHTEFQLTLVVTPKRNIETSESLPPKIVLDSPFATFSTMALDPEVHLFITELYNNTETVVAYNNELLALNAIQANTVYDKENGSFQVQSLKGDEIISVKLGPDRTMNHLSAIVSLVKDVGCLNMLKLAQVPFSMAKMTSRCHGIPKSLMATNVTALSCIKADIVTQWYDPVECPIQVSSEHSHALGSIKFQGKVVFHYENISFCYLPPFDMPMVIPK